MTAERNDLMTTNDAAGILTAKHSDQMLLVGRLNRDYKKSGLLGKTGGAGD